ncbi:VOC family protein [Paenibacillus aquistagni]|uniref:Predicted lactoylglutathione lyase n=1 Tax=Paenibacillus aquistagni TaxID=1852522 RepID=A0A1X7LJ31_9BACL|nr:VOC family protein [Paenibacillus aquistagni]SMG53898.1 Predicted lactoylglutathione lyase [Paenibacillus aquistagni]
MNKFSHIDLRVNHLERALPFYEQLLPALGFTRTFHSANWRVFAADGELPSAAYFAITEDPKHQPNQNLIGFWASDREEVDRIAALVQAAGGSITSGPEQLPISPTYYAVYFEDPCGNKYELVHRLN